MTPSDSTTLLSGPEFWLSFCGTFAAAYAALALAQLGRRLMVGATVAQLVRDRFHECPPLRGVCWAGVVGLWGAFGVTGETTLRAGYRLYQAYESTARWDHRLVAWVVGGLAAALGAVWLARGFRRWIEGGRPTPPEVSAEVRQISEGIPGRYLAGLGAESFPNQIARTWRIGLWIRRLLVVLFVGAVAYLACVWAWEGFDLHARPDLAHWPVIRLREVLESLGRLNSTFLAGVTPFPVVVAGYAGLAVFWQFLGANRNYLLLGFPAHGALLLVSGGLAWAMALRCVGPQAALLAGAVMVLFLAWRLKQDLGLAKRYQDRQRLVSPIIDQIARLCPFLAQLPRAAAEHYPALDREELGRRLTRGIKNLEEAGSLVTRHFGRYLRLATVRHERCAVATLRYLAVSRGSGLGRGWPVRDALRYPQVPAWDLTRFPLMPPEGYQSQDQVIELGGEWNAVVLCGQCGGSGTITVTESYQEPETRYETEYSGGQSRSVTRTVYVTKTRTVTRTCPTCSGTGRVEHVQVLGTYWRHFHCSATSPRLPMPELAEHAEEVTFFDRPFVEGFQEARADASASLLGESATAELEAAGNALSDVSDRHAPEVLRFLGGQYVYRSGFAVHGFHTLRISFGRLLMRQGWFFGRRPEFYFPRLPLSWSTVLARVLGLPAWIWLIYWGAKGAGRLVMLP
ncbi:MAG: hypothetical protein IT581_23515 [Verrucomicrobiales bacterium]|nr:hypothetical protein [Verrucomicrobiales bacterium]